MTNGKYKPRGITHFTHNPTFLKGMRDKRLGKRVSVENTMGDDVLMYEYGRLFAAMNPGVGVTEIKRKERELEQHVLRAWNDFARANNFGSNA